MGILQKKIVQDNIFEANKHSKFDLLCSDICPEFTGNKLHDHTKSYELNVEVIKFSYKILKKSGHLVIKTFDGELANKIFNELSRHFGKVNRFKPNSSRFESSELYLVCLGFNESELISQEINDMKEMQTNKEKFEAKKKETIREYKVAVLSCFHKEDIETLKKKLIKFYKVDPNTINLEDAESKEIIKQIDEEDQKV